MDNLIQIKFNTSFELKSSDLKELAAFEIAKFEHQLKEAESIANRVGCGLTVQIYEDHTEFFIDRRLPAGFVQSSHYRGGHDDRDRWIL